MPREILVTKSNLHLICHRIKQFVSRHGCISLQGFYRYSLTGRVNKYMPGSGLFGQNITERTIKNYMLAHDCRIEANNRYGVVFDFAHGTHCGAIKFGDKITFCPTRITINTKHCLSDGEGMLDIWQPADFEHGMLFSSKQKELDEWYDSIDEEYDMWERA